MLLLVSACGEEKQAVDDHQNNDSHEDHRYASGDVQEETASATILPSF